MKRTNVAQLVDDLAAQWTEPALAMLKAAGVHPISVEMELDTWRSLKRALHSELRRQLWDTPVALKPAARTDFVPRLQALALGG